MDSDDWIHPEMLERLLNAAQKDHVSVAICGCQETAEEALAPQPEMLESVLWTPDHFYLNQNCNATVAWGKLYEKRCFETLRYPVGKIHEDEYLTYRIIFQFPQISVIPAPLYAYFINSNGITKSTWSPRKTDAWGAYKEQIVFFHNTGRVELARKQLQVLFWNVRSQILEIRELENSWQYSQELRQAKREFRFVLHHARELECPEIITNYRKMMWDEYRVLPFIWKAELEKWWRNRKLYPKRKK